MSYGLRDLDGVRVELCDECGFDDRGLGPLPAAFAEVYASLQQLERHPDAGRRPEEETWSGSEYAEHCVDVADQILAICDRAAGRPESASVVSLSQAAAATDDLMGALSATQWEAVTDGWPFEVRVRGALIHLLHDLEHHVLDVRRGYAKLALADGVEVVTSRR
ncbi:hypothetical protein GON03_10570 [Nocardioides sp. MAH-18]|uniref:DinB family protein n=1 Tax=Nocardioides agri TaxID=2682843 RepID=A0A6L6XVN8_9ACTN|nr:MULTISPECIES: hypothetical protein [unclassified Nocardioides]MBA2954770.1 hypothetical protein [Nocardioides sp. CGMCC 1.13656]MVQ49625.1 hypothetical protein [Nocardioides sp. MAH-18]